MSAWAEGRNSLVSGSRVEERVTLFGGALCGGIIRGWAASLTRLDASISSGFKICSAAAASFEIPSLEFGDSRWRRSNEVMDVFEIGSIFESNISIVVELLEINCMEVGSDSARKRCLLACSCVIFFSV